MLLMSQAWRLLVSVLLVIVVAGIATSFYFYYESTANPQERAIKETEALIAEVSKILLLPAGSPTVATVVNKEALSNEAFFTDAMVGDKLLIYPEARCAILYRPGERKIINAAPLVFNNESTQLVSPPTVRTSSVTDNGGLKNE